MSDTFNFGSPKGSEAAVVPSSARFAASPDRAQWLNPYREVGKRAFDVAFVLIFAPLIVPVLAILALLIARDGHAPLFLQRRVGRDGRAFTILKLRTMVPDAENVLQELVAADPVAAREWHLHQKLRRDPRVTRLGAVLRRSSLDELPQLWNVLTGDMSLVGPRPMMPNQRGMYPGTAYFGVRPGITGLWQVSSRNENTFASRADYDAHYVRTLSLWLDLKTLGRTAKVVVRGTGC